MDAEPLRLALDAATAASTGISSVGALLVKPAGARSCLVLAHGAGAGMDHAFLADGAEGFAARGVATLRFQFPFMERGGRRTDSPAVAVATVRAAVSLAGEHCGGLPIVAGGKSFGGRMASHAAAEGAIPQARGLVFLGFPLHPADRPGVARAAHLPRVACPMLFVQGTRDALADLALLRTTVEPLGARATLHVVDDADHAFHVRASSGRRDPQALSEILDAAANWIGRIATA